MLGEATALYRDFLHSRDQLAPHLGPAFEDEASLAQLAARLQRRTYQRELLARALDDLAVQSSAPAAVKGQIESLRRPDSLVVFAGQQAGLFTGPLYAIYKALTAERWAADLARRLAVPVIPCFWLCSDDHDFAEVDHVDVPCAGRVTTVRYVPASAPSGTPIGRVVLDSGIEVAIDALRKCLPESALAAAALDEVARCYPAGATLSSAFASLWYRMFPDSKLLFVAPDHPALAKLAAPLLARALADDAQLHATYASASIELEAAGYHRQAHKVPSQTFLFHQHPARHAIHKVASGRFAWEGAEPVSADLLQQMCEARPEEFSPDVLLRPVVQNALFPTVGVVLGPAEVAYYAQIGGLHDHFDAPRPATLARTSVTLLERSTLQRLAEHDIDIESLRTDADREVARVLRARFPPDIELKLQAATQRINTSVAELGADLSRFDPALGATVRAAAARIDRQMNTVSDKAHAAHRRREHTAQAQIRSVALHLFPRGGLQERSFNIVYYWARYGRQLLDALHRQWPIGRRDPLLWEIGAP